MAKMFDFDGCFEMLRTNGYADGAKHLEDCVAEALQPEVHGKLADWIAHWDNLPDLSPSKVVLNEPAVAAVADIDVAVKDRLERGLQQFHPWRKGPFDLFSVRIDTEWRSDWKWERIKDHVELRNRHVLDVGCGNGYFGWRMLAEGARSVVGLDPFLLYVVQHEVLKKYLGAGHPNFVLPLSDSHLPAALNAFDVTFSMGVLYHRASPIEHLQTLHQTLQRGGQLVLETLILDAAGTNVLVPERRYAKMRNVWFIPTLEMLSLWLRRTGFSNIKVVDVTATSTDEQRSTDWMTFESLPDFLHGDDSRKTIEGYQAPIRAVLTATT